MKKQHTKKEKKKERRKIEWKKMILPGFIFILFLSASIAYYMAFSTPSYQNKYEKVAYNYVKELAQKANMPSPIASKDYSQEDFYHVVYVAITKDKVIPIYVTNDLRFVSHLKAKKMSNNSIEAISLALATYNLNLPVDNLSQVLFKRDLNTSYEVYQVKENGVALPIYFLVGKEYILLFAKNASNYLKD